MNIRIIINDPLQKKPSYFTTENYEDDGQHIKFYDKFGNYFEFSKSCVLKISKFQGDRHD
jgi:hypothetical protein